MDRGSWHYVLLFCFLTGAVMSASVQNKAHELYKRGERVVRQQTTPQPTTCSNQNDCYNGQYNVPQRLVECNQDGRCECRDCFMYDPGLRHCFNCSDYLYFASNETCGNDNRQDQRRAFFLSLFFSSTGAANFYIKSYGLAVGQLIVLIVFIVSVVVVICPCCICCGCVSKEGAIKGTCLFIVLFVLSVVFVVVMGALIVSWWIGDLSIFAGNERKTGSGCFPISNL